MIKFHPILYSTPMVKSILNNLKNQTRRTKGLEFFNQAPEKYRYDGNDQPDLLEPLDKNFHWFEFVGSDGKPMEAYKSVKCPYGQVGDILWVRETFAYSDDLDEPYWYKQNFEEEYNEEYLDRMKGIWKPSIHMPKEAARIFLEITNIRIERLKDISDSDAKNEGVELKIYPSQNFYRTYTMEGIYDEFTAKDSFETLWIHINGSDSWYSNPWVWVIEFKQIEKPQNFI